MGYSNNSKISEGFPQTETQNTNKNQSIPLQNIPKKNKIFHNKIKIFQNKAMLMKL